MKKKEYSFQIFYKEELITSAYISSNTFRDLKSDLDSSFTISTKLRHTAQYAEWSYIYSQADFMLILIERKAKGNYYFKTY